MLSLLIIFLGGLRVVAAENSTVNDAASNLFRDIGKTIPSMIGSTISYQTHILSSSRCPLWGASRKTIPRPEPELVGKPDIRLRSVWHHRGGGLRHPNWASLRVEGTYWALPGTSNPS